MLKIGDWGFEVRAFGLAVRAYANDVELSAGPFGLTLLPDGVFLRGRSGERHWYWDEVGALFGRSIRTA